MNLGHMKILERKQSQKTSGFIFFYEWESCFRSKSYLYGSGSSDPYREKTDLEPNLMNPAVVDPTKLYETGSENRIIINEFTWDIIKR